MDDALDVGGMFHDGFITFNNVVVYGHETRTRYLLNNLLEKVNGKKEEAMGDRQLAMNELKT